MPTMNGDELLANLRISGDIEKTPFIVLTARGDRDSAKLINIANIPLVRGI